jgi:endo-1,4-beta-xylanase
MHRRSLLFFSAFQIMTFLTARGTLLDPSKAQSFGFCEVSRLPDGSVAAVEREFEFSGPSWDILASVQANESYLLLAECTVSIGAATLKMSIAEHLGAISWNPNIGSADTSLGKWALISASYTMNPHFDASKGDKLIVYVEGAAAGVDLICRSPAAAGAPSSLKAAAAQTKRLIGAAVDERKLKDPKYSAALVSDFNFVTSENAMKWDATEPSPGHFDFAGGDALVAFAEAHNMSVKLHTLVWGEQLPSWVANTDVRQSMLNHIAGVVTHYKGRAQYIDVINEVIDDKPGSKDGMKSTLFQDRLGRSFVEDAFRAAHKIDPDALLVANDYGVEQLSDKSQRFYDMMAYLVSRKVPVHGVGFQCHFDGSEKMGDIANNMQRLADLGLFILVSELDVQYKKFPGDEAAKLQAQGYFYKKVVTVCMAQQACKGVSTWGVMDSQSWLLTQVAPDEKPLLLDNNFNRKPAWSGVLQALSDPLPSISRRRLLQSEAKEGPLPLWASSPVTVTYYESPGMKCSDGLGACGLGNTAGGETTFLKDALYPLHAASGNFEFLGGCSACGVLSYHGLARGYMITDVTDKIDSLGERPWPPAGAHIDLCCDQFSYFQSLDHGHGIDCGLGGEFNAIWTRVPCETMGSPNYPGDGVVVRTTAWNKFAKALFVARMPGVGEVQSVDFATRDGGYFKGQKVQGWLAWFTPGQDLSGKGGIGIKVTMVDGTVHDWTK